MIDQRLNFFDNLWPDVYICPLRKKSAPLLQEEECISFSEGNNKMYTSGSIANSQRMITEINESGK